MLIVKGLLGGLFQLALISTFLLLPAGLIPGGTWCWKRAIIFIGVFGFILESSLVTLAVVSPANLKARLRAPISKKQPVADRVVTVIAMLTFFGWFVSIPIDVFFLKALPKPQFVVSLCGGLLCLLGFAIVTIAISQNSFAMQIVEDQTERGQVLVDSGLYAFVRHPFYLGMIPFIAGVALWLESYTCLVAASILLVPLVIRIFVEEKTLQKTLPGYREYMKKVRYRLVPFVW